MDNDRLCNTLPDDTTVLLMAPQQQSLQKNRLLHHRHTSSSSSSSRTMRHFHRLAITLTISLYLCLGYCTALGSAENGGGGGRSKFGLYIVRSPESTIAPIGDEVVLECGLSVNPDRIMWRFLPQNASKDHRRNFRIIESNSVSRRSQSSTSH